MKRRWRMLSFRVGVLGTAALAALVAAAALLTGREPLAAALLLCAAAGWGPWPGCVWSAPTWRRNGPC